MQAVKARMSESAIRRRFRRVEGARSRTHEGTGIGLALVQELVKLHSGSVCVDSIEGKGSTFTVSIPRGKAHLPAERIGAEPFIEEALNWLPDAMSVARPSPDSSAMAASKTRTLLSSTHRCATLPAKSIVSSRSSPRSLNTCARARNS